ncbi:hypothetical protein BD779DRAFT_1487011 [Infundibulicybe gibba]|nr:hypothetical protein BD779DRAFT_1487011 [Infundibulicybe gibba]
MASSLPISPPSSLTPSDIELANRAADQFTKLYYSSYDASTRLINIPQFYRPSSSLTWNGKPYQGVDGLKELIEKMPMTKHEVVSFDCHPIPGTQPPSLLITVSGNVTHGQGLLEIRRTFMLVPDAAAAPSKPGEVAKYYISADALRFVG